MFLFEPDFNDRPKKFWVFIEAEVYVNFIVQKRIEMETIFFSVLGLHWACRQKLYNIWRKHIVSKSLLSKKVNARTGFVKFIIWVSSNDEIIIQTYRLYPFTVEIDSVS